MFCCPLPGPIWRSRQYVEFPLSLSKPYGTANWQSLTTCPNECIQTSWHVLALDVSVRIFYDNGNYTSIQTLKCHKILWNLALYFFHNKKATLIAFAFCLPLDRESNYLHSTSRHPHFSFAYVSMYAKLWGRADALVWSAVKLTIWQPCIVQPCSSIRQLSFSDVVQASSVVTFDAQCVILIWITSPHRAIFFAVFWKDLLLQQKSTTLPPHHSWLASWDEQQDTKGVV